MAEPNGSAADGLTAMLNVFVDPVATAKRVPSPYSWVWPIAVLIIGYMVISYLMLPFTTELMEANLRNVPSERMEQARNISSAITKVTPIITVVFVIGFTALFALLIKVVYTMMDVRPKFRDVFALLACCSLIPFLQQVAVYLVLKLKHDPVESPEQMTPPFGIDIFFQSLHGAPYAFLNFFSIFQIWFIVVLVIGLAALTKTSKTKAFIAATPAWLIPMLLRVIGAMFQKPPA